jgi:hypothetical protein
MYNHERIRQAQLRMHAGFRALYISGATRLINSEIEKAKERL